MFSRLEMLVGEEGIKKIKSTYHCFWSWWSWWLCDRIISKKWNRTYHNR